MLINENTKRGDWEKVARILAEALPFLRRYRGQCFVIKYGGHAMDDQATAMSFARDMVLLKQVGIHPVIVHGGGPQIEAMLKRLNIKSEFKNGLRVTDAATMEVVEMVLSGRVNKELVQCIRNAGGVSFGLSGKDGNLVTARKSMPGGVDLGFVGEPVNVNPYILRKIIEEDAIPVVAPVSVDEEGVTLNVNADTAAGAIAAALKAVRFLLLTDVQGLLDKNKQLIPEISVDDAQKAIDTGIATGGMIPKLQTCIQAIQGGVKGAVILNGRDPHSVLLELLTPEGTGTLIR
ncbi:MAG TPA: acetylglutamate kinase [Alphaproteobacteria bacterium]|nr:acetylglutamate kinase [Alphaproteobacteria bacterium]